MDVGVLKKWAAENLYKSNGSLKFCVNHDQWWKTHEFEIYRTEILKLTAFLNPSAKISERLYCIENNITSVQVCSICGKPVRFLHTREYNPTCSNKCGFVYGNLRRKKSCLKKYGVENPLKNKDVINKYDKTMIEKYGVDNVFKLKEVQKQIKLAHLKKYGVENVSQSEIIKNKKIETFKKHYGKDHYFQTEEFGIAGI